MKSEILEKRKALLIFQHVTVARPQDFFELPVAKMGHILKLIIFVST
jgi:hypothetical protein